MSPTVRCWDCGVAGGALQMAYAGDGKPVCARENGGGRTVVGCRVKIIGERQAGDSRPDRCAKCRWCGRMIERVPSPDAPWTTAKLGGLAGVNTECPDRPHADRFGEHEPGAPVVRPPAAAPTVLVEPKAGPPPVIPVIPPPPPWS